MVSASRVSEKRRASLRSPFWQRVWRWHFMAGLMVIPFAIILAVTGAIYLFKPQFDAGIEARINARAAPLLEETLPADALLGSALEAYPGATLAKYVIASSPDDRTVEIDVRTPEGLRTLWVDRSTGSILHDTPTPGRFMNMVKRIHGTLLAGNRGSLVVEIMASWMIILIITGAFLWWPRGAPVWRFLVPDLSPLRGRREIFRRLHGTLGAWAGGLILVMLLTGLPWTQVWGAGYGMAKEAIGLKAPGQEWFVTLTSSDPHAHHGGDHMHDAGASLWERGDPHAGPSLQSGGAVAGATPLSLEDIYQIAQPQAYQPPVEIQPPRGENGVWTIRSMGPDRAGRVTAHYDRWSGAEIMRITYADHNRLDQVVAQGVAFHEGQLFGPLNQAVGVFAALSVVMLSVTGALMWWRRRPSGRLGVPAMPDDKRITLGVFGLILGLCVFLPMAGVTLVIALSGELMITGVRKLLGRSAA